MKRALAYATLSWKLAVLFALAAVPVAGCGAALPPPARALCEGQAQARAQARVNAECKQDAGPCPTKDSILAQLQKDQEACK